MWVDGRNDDEEEEEDDDEEWTTAGLAPNHATYSTAVLAEQNNTTISSSSGTYDRLLPTYAVVDKKSNMVATPTLATQYVHYNTLMPLNKIMNYNSAAGLSAATATPTTLHNANTIINNSNSNNVNVDGNVSGNNSSGSGSTLQQQQVTNKVCSDNISYIHLIISQHNQNIDQRLKRAIILVRVQ